MRRIYKIIAAATAGALIIGLSVYSIILDNERKSLQNQLAGFYQSSFEGLVTNMDSLETKLCKLEAANGTNQYSTLLMDVWRQTGDTESMIAGLPVSYQGSSTLTQFMNRTGDFCRYLSDKLSRGEALTSDDMKQIQSLASACGEISKKINDAWEQGYSADIGSAGDVFMTGEVKGKSLDFTNQQFPRLIYDGPFSESTENKQPQGLRIDVVSQQQAQENAASFLGMEASALSYGGDLNGNIASYGFTGQQNGFPFTIYITKQGGQVLWYMSQRDTGISAIPTAERYGQLTEIAKQYLSSKGYGDTASSYAQFYGGMAIINLAPVQNGIVLYPDLIKVWVDITAGDVAGMDANNYIMSHSERQLSPPALDQAHAQSKLNSNLQVTNVRLALIPLNSGGEKVCYEFTGTVNGNQYLVYINAQSGMEEDILMIQDTNEGKLVM